MFLVLGALLVPGASWAQFQNLEADARTVPWSSLTRMALEAGEFPPAIRPVTEGEIAKLLARSESVAMARQSLALTDDHEYARLLWLLDRYKNGHGGVAWHGCECKVNPPHLRFNGRVIGGYSELANPVPFEGGLSFAAGHNIYLEPAAEFVAGSFWAVANFRLGGRWADGGTSLNGVGQDSNPLTWPGWDRATGRQDVRDARLNTDRWQGQLTRALVGVHWGSWSLSAGWDQRRTGPGLTGDLNLDYQGKPFPALTARRTSSFQWAGIMEHLAPDQTLLRAGVLSERAVAYRDAVESYSKQAQPWFMQWLVGWNVTPWFRTHFTHTVMVTARDETLWPDLLQINFPVIGTTWRELESGPITDRIFAAQFEFRWRDAPWPVLPASGGRLFWDYGGTDFLPSGPGGLVPEISIPATVVGFEMVSPRWDVAFEYAELQHDKVMWYTNGGYREGYTHEQTLLGHPLGGSGEAVTGLVRVRPAGWNFQWSLQGRLATWGMLKHTPGEGARTSVGLSLRRTPRADGVGAAGDSDMGSNLPLLWEITAEWNREKVDPDAFARFPAPDSEVARHWWRLVFKVGI